MHVNDHFRRGPFQHLEMMDRDLSRRQVHFFALSRHLIGFAALHLHRRVRRRRLFDLSNEGAEHFFELIFGHIDRYIRMRKLAIRVEGVRGRAETNNGLIALVRS